MYSWLSSKNMAGQMCLANERLKVKTALPQAFLITTRKIKENS